MKPLLSIPKHERVSNERIGVWSSARIISQQAEINKYAKKK